MSMPVQMSPAQDDKRQKVDDQRLDLADDLKEAQYHISSTITSHKTKITTSKYKISNNGYCTKGQNEAKQTKPSTGMERVQEIEA
ncbi:hypothetical protein Tco_0850763 [Tanacetum coccineum]